MTTPIKVAIGLGTIGTVGGATYAGVHYLSPNLQISKLIDEEYKHILLDTTEGKDTENWKANWTAYKNEKNNVFNLAGWKSEDNTSLDLTKELKQKCASLKVSYVYGRDDDLYKNVTKYCSRWVTVEDEAKKNQLNVISTERTPVDVAWTTMVTEGEKAKWTNDFNNLNIKPSTGTSSAAVTAENVKKGCKDAIKKNKGESNYQTIYDSYKKVCVKQG